MSAPCIHVSYHAIERYRERVLGIPLGPIDRIELQALEAEIFCLVRRCQRVTLPRFVVTVPTARFMIVQGVVVTNFSPDMRAWVGIHRPGYKIEVQHNAG